MKIIGIVVVFAVACGSSTTNSSSSSEQATGNTLTAYQKQALLGHYTTPNGQSGFILDRTTTPWRAKLDGVDKVVVMKKTNTPHQGEEEYTSDDQSIWIRVNVDSGDVLLFQGPKQHEGVDVTRDADAKQLN